MKVSKLFLAFGVLFTTHATASDDIRTFVGDPLNGKKLYDKECAACHGKNGDGGRTSVSLTDSGRMNLIRDDQMFSMIQVGRGLKKPGDHSFTKKLKFLEIWDVIAHVREGHMTIGDFFPTASRYVSKTYEIDKFGLDRIKERAGVTLKDKKAAVFTFFTFEGEEGNLQYIPQDPIKLDHLSKDKKSGYLVFLPFEHAGFSGELGVAMDPDGQITKLLVHRGAKNADLLNKDLSRFEGMGKKNQAEPFKVGGGKKMDAVAKKVFPVFMRAMETVTMYDREENERTWADPN
ncbi:MAG: c-type cytochrome [Deltaproteobacteria bacterium]|jgi:hypothetical protein